MSQLKYWVWLSMRFGVRPKVKLALVECFDYTYKPEPPVYFFQGDHIDKFTYSPPECAKHIETVFA